MEARNPYSASSGRCLCSSVELKVLSRELTDPLLCSLRNGDASPTPGGAVPSPELLVFRFIMQTFFWFTSCTLVSVSSAVGLCGRARVMHRPDLHHDQLHTTHFVLKPPTALTRVAGLDWSDCTCFSANCGCLIILCGTLNSLTRRTFPEALCLGRCLDPTKAPKAMPSTLLYSGYHRARYVGWNFRTGLTEAPGACLKCFKSRQSASTSK